MAEIEWSPMALSDVESIAEYIARDSVHFAEIQVTLFFDHVQVLQTKPYGGRIVPDSGIVRSGK